MPQFKFQASANAKEMEKTIKEAGSTVAGVKWVNVNADGLVVVTADEGFDTAPFIAAVQSIDPSITEVA